MKINRLLIAGVVAVAVAAVGWFTFGRGGSKKDAEPYKTAQIDRGDVLRAVSATGRLEPLELIEISSQLSGQMAAVLVDFNDPVTEGQELARLDPATFEQRVSESEADLSVQQANLKAAQAAAERARVDLAEVDADYRRQKSLGDKGFASASALEKAGLARDRARSALVSAEASVAVARARVEQSEATLASRKTDLDRTVLRSPADGVVVNRAVGVGQTVASSLQAPVLFTIAQDLKRMRVEIAVDEADIGEVRPGQPIRFTVDAFPDANFEGRVDQVRKQPEVANNVVTYTVTADADNADGRLLPGMTANVEIVLEERKGVLRVDNAALRWSPQGVAAPLSAAGAGAPSGPAVGGPLAAGGAGGGRGQMIERLKERLALTDEQMKELRPVFEEAQGKMRALFEGARASGSFDGLRPRMQALTEEIYAKIEPKLTDEQKVKLAELKAEAAARGSGPRAVRGGVVWTLAEGGKPKSVRVRLGASDTRFTEIQPVEDGALKEGATVVTGGGAPPQASSQPRGGGGRIRFP